MLVSGGVTMIIGRKGRWFTNPLILTIGSYLTSGTRDIPRSCKEFCWISFYSCWGSWGSGTYSFSTKNNQPPGDSIRDQTWSPIVGSHQQQPLEGSREFTIPKKIKKETIARPVDFHDDSLRFLSDGSVSPWISWNWTLKDQAAIKRSWVQWHSLAHTE